MKSFIIVFLLIFSFSSSAYARKRKMHKVPVDNYKYYVADGTELSQTKNGLTIEIIPLSPGLMFKYPDLFAWQINNMPKDWRINLSTFYKKNPEDGNYYEYPFGAGENYLNVYLIKITNKTGHIIRMRDARIYMLVDGENPISPVTNFGDATLVNITPNNSNIFKSNTLLPRSVLNQDRSLVYWVTDIYHEWDVNRKKGFIHFVYPIGLPSQILLQNGVAKKLINDIKAEILPDFSFSGILLFPRIIHDNEINIEMYDFPTKTDAAGNVTERSNFNFKLKLKEGTMYYDRNTNKWIGGKPPQEEEYYDKKLKKWIYGIPKK